VIQPPSAGRRCGQLARLRNADAQVHALWGACPKGLAVAPCKAATVLYALRACNQGTPLIRMGPHRQRDGLTTSAPNVETKPSCSSYEFKLACAAVNYTGRPIFE
jgi:hypothetical protein